MKTSVASLLVLCSVSCFSQSYKKIRVGLGFGLPSVGSNISPTLLHFEPAFRINDKVILGTRVEGALLYQQQRQFTSLSFSINSQYYFSESEKMRPFIGAGVGVFSVNQTGVSSGVSCGCLGQTEAEKVAFGFYPRVGFDTGHFTIGLEYNIVPTIKETTINWNGETFVTGFSANYFAFKIGGFIGGGKKKKN